MELLVVLRTRMVKMTMRARRMKDRLETSMSKSDLVMVLQTGCTAPPLGVNS